MLRLCDHPNQQPIINFSKIIRKNLKKRYLLCTDVSLVLNLAITVPSALEFDRPEAEFLRAVRLDERQILKARVLAGHAHKEAQIVEQRRVPHQHEV